MGILKRSYGNLTTPQRILMIELKKTYPFSLTDCDSRWLHEPRSRARL